jgi:UDP-N-acetylglucosamine 4,6-dehydratase/5-epimerase
VFKGKKLLITGGTGSFGGTVLKRFINEDFDEIRIFSRDEKKQEDQRLRFRNGKLRFYIGDVRDRSAVQNVMQDVDYVFHAAALKQVPSCEFHPIEAVKTNVLGTENVLNVAIEQGVSRVICLSTDKAVYPVNAMGISKAMMEKVMVAKARLAGEGQTIFCCTRYGNVLASRGSVVPLFVKQIRDGLPITITDPGMTRFVMSLPEALDLVLYAFTNGGSGDIFVQKAPAARIDVLAKAVCTILGRPDHPINVIGTRHGEKRYESLLSREEMASAVDEGNYYKVPPDNRDLNYSTYIDQGKDLLSQLQDYNSDNTTQLNVAQTAAKLMSLDYMRRVLANENADGEE